MGDKRKDKQPPGISGDIFCVVIAFRYKITHDRASNSADEVHCDRKSLTGIPRKQQPRNMVYCHGYDRYDFYRICV